MESIRTYVSFDPHNRVISRKTRFFFIVIGRESVPIDSVEWIDAFNRDALTHDEVFIRFHTEQGGMVVSEFDQGFSTVVSELAAFFPGIERWNDVTPKSPLTEASLTLWVGSRGRHSEKADKLT